MVKRNSKGQLMKGHGGLKPKGAVSKKTEQWKMIGEYLANEGAERFAKVMIDSEDKEFMQYYRDILEYFKPKLSRSDQNNTGELNINVNYTDPDRSDD